MFCGDDCGTIDARNIWTAGAKHAHLVVLYNDFEAYTVHAQALLNHRPIAAFHDSPKALY